MKKVLFVCIGNCCRSPMAEGFANHYGKDVLRATSAGLSPTAYTANETIETMRAKNIDISHHIPQRFHPLMVKGFDIIVNMSGFDLPGKPANVRTWHVKDPFGDSPAVYNQVCNDLELKVMHLILELRRGSGKAIASSQRKERRHDGH